MAKPIRRRIEEPAARDMPWQDAIQKVLAESDGALHYTEIAERISSSKLRGNVGATPAQTVAANLSESLRSPNSPYLRVGRGEYTLQTSAKPVQMDKESAEKALNDTTEAGALRAFGMYWQRNLVAWSGSPVINGRQAAGASDVNFASQRGVYLLHDRERVIYVGRTDKTLFERLKAHTTDRLGGRWDRFSWFGLLSVGEEGNGVAPVVPDTKLVDDGCHVGSEVLNLQAAGRRKFPEYRSAEAFGHRQDPDQSGVVEYEFNCVAPFRSPGCGCDQPADQRP